MPVLKAIAYIGLLLLPLLCGAQRYAWARPLKTEAFPKGIASDQAGNFYSYGSGRGPTRIAEAHLPDDTTGSYFLCLSRSGQEQFRKTWRTSFFLEKVIEDGNDGFYFTGSFFGTVEVDGILLSAKGSRDGCIGRIGAGGNIAWVKPFGGDAEDAGFDLCLSADGQEIVVTGAVGGHLYVDGALKQSSSQKSLLLIRFGLNGDYLGHRLIDFVPGLDSWSTGEEIRPAGAGGYFVKGFREGRHPMDYEADEAFSGYYVWALNDAFEIVWERSVVNQSCYYGYECRALASSGSGDVFIASECKSKYGGMARLDRLDRGTGQETWTLGNKDGSYPSTCFARNNLYVSGTEGAYACPCDANRPGYQVIKSYDAHNRLRFEERIEQSRPLHIFCHESGQIYATGLALKDEIEAGPFRVQAGTMDYLHRTGLFVVALEDIDYATARRKTEDRLASVYPNPSKGEFTVKVPPSAQSSWMEVRVLAPDGRTVHRSRLKMNAGEREKQVGTEGLAAGIYFVEIEHGGRTETRQLMVE